MNWILQFVLKQFAKKSARKTGISKLLKANDPIVQSNVRNITIQLKNMGINPKNLTSTDDVLQAMNYHKAMVDQHLKKHFEKLDLGGGWTGIKSLEKTKKPFQGWTPKVVPKETEAQIKARIKKQNKEATERLKAKKKREWWEDIPEEEKGPWDVPEKPWWEDDLASGGIARVGYFKGKLVEGAGWFIKNFKSLIDEAANPGPWSRFSKMGAKDKQAAIADAKEMIKRLEAGDPIPEYLLEDIVANPKFTLKRSKAHTPDLAEVENLVEGYSRLKNARANKFRGNIEDFRTGNTINSSAALDDYDLFTPITKDMYGKTWKGKKNWIKEERAKALKTKETIGPAPSSRHPNYRSMVQIRKSLEDKLTALDITEELGGNIKMFDKLRMHNYPTYKNTLDKRDWLMPPGGLKRREAFVIDLGHHTLPPIKKAEGGIAGQLHLNDGGRVPFLFGGSGIRNLLKWWAKRRSKEGLKGKVWPDRPSAEMKNLMSAGEKETYSQKRIEWIETILAGLKKDKELVEHLGKAEKMGDPGLDFMMGHFKKSFDETGRLGKYKNIDKDIMDMEMILKNLKTKGRKLNAEGGIAGQLHLNDGGRVSFTKGGKVSSGLAHVLGV